MKSNRIVFWRWNLAIVALGLVWGMAPVCRAEEKPVAKEKKESKFLRIHRDEKGNPLSLDTSIVSYVSDKAPYAGAQVDLIGAVHVGENKYYEQLNEIFTKYDAVLYELVAPEGTRIPKDGRPKGNAHPVGMMQNGMKSMLGLEHQLEKIDYTKANLIHADMSPEDFAKSMADRNESFSQIFLRMMGQSMARQAADPLPSGETQIFSALFSKNRNTQMKRALAQQFENVGGAVDIMEGEDGSTLITERNKKAFTVLDRELRAGKKKVAVFYGAGHLMDMEKRLLADFGMKQKEERWLAAWSLVEEPTKSTPSKKSQRKKELKEQKNQ